MEFLKMRRGEERVVEVMRVGGGCGFSIDHSLGDESLRGWAEGRHIHSWVVKVVLLSLPINCFMSRGAGQRVFLLGQLLHLYLPGIP